MILDIAKTLLTFTNAQTHRNGDGYLKRWEGWHSYGI